MITQGQHLIKVEAGVHVNVNDSKTWALTPCPDWPLGNGGHEWDQRACCSLCFHPD